MGNFVGKGYSEKFTVNMRRIITSLENGENLILVNGADDICRACPYSSAGVCRDEEKVRRYDSAVCDVLLLEYGKEYVYNDLKNNVMDRVCRTEKLSEICGDCEWSELCGQIYQNKLKKFYKKS